MFINRIIFIPSLRGEGMVCGLCQLETINLLKLCSQLVASQVSGNNDALWVNEEACWDGGDAVSLTSYSLPTLKVGEVYPAELHVFNSLLPVLKFVVERETNDFKSL